jgi:hypothetical protein
VGRAHRAGPAAHALQEPGWAVLHVGGARGEGCTKTGAGYKVQGVQGVQGLEFAARGLGLGIYGSGGSRAVPGVQKVQGVQEVTQGTQV